MSGLYPVYLNLDQKKCLVVGGGNVAERKVISLLESGARVYVVSPALSDRLEEMAGEHKLTVIRRCYTTTDLEDAFLVIGATDNPGINERVARDCQERNILVNIADNPDWCNFMVPAVLRQGALSISISTDGKSPMLARRIRERLEPEFGPEYCEFLELMGNVREYVIRTIPEEKSRKDTFQRLIDSDILDLLKDGQREKVKERITHVLGDSWTQS